jgi:hypothetical protein
MLLFLLIFLCLIMTVADRLGYVNPNIQTRLLAASTIVAILTSVAYDLCVIELRSRSPTDTNIEFPYAQSKT